MSKAKKPYKRSMDLLNVFISYPNHIIQTWCSKTNKRNIKMKVKSKVGILNFQYSKHNYGAVLQAAALEYTIDSLGYDAKHIDFQPVAKSTMRSKIGKILRKLNLKKWHETKIFNEEAFEVFRSQFIKRTTKIHTKKEFRNLTKNLDTVVVGSDQVWRSRMSGDVLAFFLAYVPKKVKRVSYAASFGSSEWEAKNDRKLTKRIKSELKLFEKISVRESSGVDICRDIFSVEATHVLDPLLLVDTEFYNKVISSSNDVMSSNVVYYKLDGNSAFFHDLKVIGNNYGAKPQNIYLKQSDIKSYQEVSDWLKMIYNSKVVITDSFHCICLALRFDKTVIYCPNESRGQARMDSLFEMFDVELNSVKFNVSSEMYLLSKPKTVDLILKEKREESLDFLVKALRI